jgi:hypothetical protein
MPNYQDYSALPVAQSGEARFSPTTQNRSKSRAKRRSRPRQRKYDLGCQTAAEFVDKWAASQLTGLSPETLKKYRLSGLLIENVHWVRINSKTLRYNARLLVDWLRNRGNPQFHQQVIETYLAANSGNERES